MVAKALCACGGEMSPWLYMPIDAKKNVPTPYSSVVKCSECGFGSLSPLPDLNDVSEFYALDNYYTHGSSHIGGSVGTIFDRILTKIAWWADHSTLFEPTKIAKSLRKNAAVCDLGCGSGQYLLAFKNLGFSVIGVDPDPSARDFAREAGVEVVAGTAELLPNLGRQFDLVIMTHSLEHCVNPEKALANAFALTKPGGLCYVEVPNCDSEHFRTFTICSEMFDAPRHIHFFTPTALERACDRAGFHRVKRLFSGYVRDFGPGWRAWESDIAMRVGGKRHDFVSSFGLLCRSFWRSAGRKYDSIGLILSRADADADLTPVRFSR